MMKKMKDLRFLLNLFTHSLPLFQCHSLAETNEEHLEDWFYNRQEIDPSLETFLCVKKLSYCCDSGYFGPECSACPGLKESQKACFGRGLCDVIFEFL